MSNFTLTSKNVSYLDIILTQLAHFDIRQIACSQKKRKNENCHDRAVELLLRLCAKFQLMARPHVQTKQKKIQKRGQGNQAKTTCQATAPSLGHKKRG